MGFPDIVIVVIGILTSFLALITCRILSYPGWGNSKPKENKTKRIRMNKKDFNNIIKFIELSPLGRVTVVQDKNNKILIDNITELKGNQAITDPILPRITQKTSTSFRADPNHCGYYIDDESIREELSFFQKRKYTKTIRNKRKDLEFVHSMEKHIEKMERIENSLKYMQLDNKKDLSGGLSLEEYIGVGSERTSNLRIEGTQTGRLHPELVTTKEKLK